MDEHHFAEIDATLLYIEEARGRADRAIAELRRSGADEHLIEALEGAKDRLSETGRGLRQGTYFAVPSAQSSL